MYPFHQSKDLFAISSDLEQPPQGHPITLINPQDLIRSDYVHPRDHAVFSFSLSSHGQEMLGGHQPRLRPNYSLPKPFVSGRTTNDSNKAREDADGDEENKTKKTRHREIERQRRKEMNTLYASLRSLLPAQILKGKRAVSDQLNVALDYINQIQRNIKKLETERARLKKINNEPKGDADAVLGYQEVMSTGSCSISVQPYSSGGVEIVVHSIHEEKPLPLSGVIQALVDEGMDVVCCASTQVNGAIVHTIQSEVRDSTTLDVPWLQWKLNELLSV